MNAAIDTVLELESMDLGFIERQLVKEALAIAERRETWAMYKDRMAPIVNAIRKLGGDVALTDSLDIRLVGDARLLATAVRIMRTSGYSCSGKKPVKGDTTWSAIFTSPPCISIWFSFSSSVCRRVQVGTQMVEQPVFETVCDSIELPAGEDLKNLPPPVKAVDAPELPF
jgi:hypothetical protein